MRRRGRDIRKEGRKAWRKDGGGESLQREGREERKDRREEKGIVEVDRGDGTEGREWWKKYLTEGRGRKRNGTG